MFDYILKRSARKTLCITIGDGTLVVKSPHSMPIESIEAFLYKKQKWINKHLSLSQQLNKFSATNKKDYIFNKYIDYLGGKILLCKSSGNIYNEIIFDGMNLYIEEKFHAQLENKVTYWYKKQAKIVVQELCQVWQNKMQVHAKNIKISHGKKRLGYCTSNGDIAISWYLILQPIYVIEYVIIHELAHLVHFNHSKEFWQLVKYYCKNYSKAMEYLQKKGLKYV